MPRSYASPIFQHRHYAEIAAVLAHVRTTAADNTVEGQCAISAIEEALINVFDHDNPRFQKLRFKATAQGTPSNGKDRR